MAHAYELLNSLENFSDDGYIRESEVAVNALIPSADIRPLPSPAGEREPSEAELGSLPLRALAKVHAEAQAANGGLARLDTMHDDEAARWQSEPDPLGRRKHK